MYYKIDMYIYIVNIDCILNKPHSCYVAIDCRLSYMSKIANMQIFSISVRSRNLREKVCEIIKLSELFKGWVCPGWPRSKIPHKWSPYLSPD